MDFVNPTFLFGLFAVIIPVIIHLFNFRRFRRVYFTNVDYIRELKQETRKQSRLKHLLVLIARILAITALVFAFARPYFPLEETIIRSQERNSISVYIDNSFSMQAGSEEGTLLQAAIEKAREIAAVYKSSDQFQLLTNDFEGRHFRFVSRDEFLDLLDEVVLSPVVKNFDEVHVRQADLQRSDGSSVRSAYIISDFQKHFFAEASQGDTLMDVYFIPVQSVNTDNVFIDSCWFDSPVQQMNQLVKLYVRLRNSSGQSYEDMPVKLKLNGVQRALASFSIAPQSDKTVELSYTNTSAGIQSGELEINDYPVSFDDRFYFSYVVNPKINILAINENSSNFYLNSLFLNDTAFHFTNVNVSQLNYSLLQENDVVVLNGLSEISSGLAQEVLRFIKAGGSLLILPSGSAMDASYNDLISNVAPVSFGELDTTRQKVGLLNLDHSLYEGVFDEIPENMDLPSVNQHYVLRMSGVLRQEKIMELQNGDIFLSLFPVERGRLFLSSVALDPAFSNFQQHALFVPTLYKFAVSSIAPTDLYYLLGENEVVRVESIRRGQDEVLKIKEQGSSFEFIPEHRALGHMDELYVYQQISKAGNYFLNQGNTPITGLSFNYDRAESEMVFNTPDELDQLIKDKRFPQIRILEPTAQPFTQTLADMSKGIQLWKWFVLAALAFLLTEVVLLRFMK